MTSLPTLFISHGAPDIILTNHPACDFLRTLASSLVEAPRAILVVSAHWETARPMVSAAAQPETIHDFGGFDQRLYAMQYKASGEPQLAKRISDLLDEAGLAPALDHERGLDHGAWIPLSLAWPAGEIPVLQLSVQPHSDPFHHYKLGLALSALRHEGVLVLASGSFTHNLRSYFAVRDRSDAAEPEWVRDFADWMLDRLLRQETRQLLSYRKLAPYAEQNHPTDEHLLPLFVALGGAGEHSRAELLHSSVSHGVLRMDALAFGDLQ